MNRCVAVTLGFFFIACRAGAQDPALDAMIAALPKLDAAILGPDAPERKLRLTALQQQREAANARDRAAWAPITRKEAWENYREAKLALLRKSLGEFPARPQPPRLMTTRTVEGDGFRVENLVYESRPG